MNDHSACDATELAARVRRGEVQPAELVETAIAAIESVNPTLNAVMHPMYDAARAAVRALPDGPFRGVPMVVKDHDGFVKGTPHTSGTRFLEGFVPDHDSVAMARLRRAGLVFVAKTNLPELAILGTTEGRLRGPARNPWDPDRSTGGSSGGSAALVASRAVPLHYLHRIICRYNILAPLRGRFIVCTKIHIQERLRKSHFNRRRNQVFLPFYNLVF